MPRSFDVEPRVPRMVRWALAMLVLSASCNDAGLTTAVASDSGGSDLRATIASVTVYPDSYAATVGDTGTFAAQAFDRYGRVVSGVVFKWTSSDTNVVRVYSNGFAKARGAGAVIVAATAGGKSGISHVTVAAVPVASVAVSPSSPTVTVGDSTVFTATLRDANGNTLTGRAVVWSSSNPGALTIDSTGKARAVGAGSAQASATSGGQAGTASVTINAPAPPPAPVVTSVLVSPGSASGSVNDSAQFTATARDSSGATITGHTVTWTSTNTAVVVVSGTGMGRATGPGSAQLVATVDGVNGHSDITVTAPPPPPPPPPAPVASVSIAPNGVSVSTATSSQLTATLHDANGNVLTGRAISWASSNSLVAAVSPTGLVTGLVAGSAAITATSEGISTSVNASVTLLPPPPPPTGWPNMPSTYSVLTDQPFDPLSLAGWALIWNTNGYGTITTNATAPFSPGNVFQVIYPAGFAAGSAPATQTYSLGGKKNVYVGMWWKANANWQGEPSNVNKLQFFFPANNGGDMYMCAYGPPGGPYELRTALQFVGGDTRDWLRPNVGSGAVTMGDWHRIEWLVEYNTSGANGVVRWWLDGQLVGDYRDVVFPASGIEEYKLSPTWGGIGGVKTQTDYFWFDHILIAGH